MIETDPKKLIEVVRCHPEIHEDCLEFRKHREYYTIFTDLAKINEVRGEDDFYKRECAKPWRSLLFEFINQFHLGEKYGHFVDLQFTGICKIMTTLPETKPSVVARLKNVDHKDPSETFVGGLLNALINGSPLHMKMKNTTDIPIIIHGIHYNSTGTCYGHFPFILMPGKYMEDDFFPTTVVKIEWSILQSPINSKHNFIDVPGVTHRNTTLQFEAGSTGCCVLLNGSETDQKAVNVLPGINFVGDDYANYENGATLIQNLVNLIAENPHLEKHANTQKNYEESVLMLFESLKSKIAEFVKEVKEFSERLPGRIYFDIEALDNMICDPRRFKFQIMTLESNLRKFLKKLAIKPSEDLANQLATKLFSADLSGLDVANTVITEFALFFKNLSNESPIGPDSSYISSAGKRSGNKINLVNIKNDTTFKELSAHGLQLCDDYSDYSTVLHNYISSQSVPPMFMPRQLLSEDMKKDMDNTFPNKTKGVGNHVSGDKFESKLFYGLQDYLTLQADYFKIEKSALLHSVPIGGKESLSWSNILRMLNLSATDPQSVQEDEIDFIILLKLVNVALVVVIEAKMSYSGYKTSILGKRKFEKYQNFVNSKAEELKNLKIRVEFVTIIGGAGENPGVDEQKLTNFGDCLIVPATGTGDQRTFDFTHFFNEHGCLKEWMKYKLKDTNMKHDMANNTTYDAVFGFLVCIKCIKPTNYNESNKETKKAKSKERQTANLNTMQTEQYEFSLEYISNRHCAAELQQRLRAMDYLKTVDEKELKNKSINKTLSSNKISKQLESIETIPKQSVDGEKLMCDSRNAISSIKVSMLPETYRKYVEFFDFTYVTNEQKAVLDEPLESGLFSAIVGSYGSGKTIMFMIKLAQVIEHYKDKDKKPNILVAAPQLLMQQRIKPFLCEFFQQCICETEWINLVCDYSDFIDETTKNTFDFVFVDEWMDSNINRAFSGVLDYALVKSEKETNWIQKAKSMLITIATTKSNPVKFDLSKFKVKQLSYLLRYMPHLEPIFSNPELKRESESDFEEKPVFGHKSRIYLVMANNDYIADLEIGLKHEVEFWKTIIENANEILVTHGEPVSKSTVEYLRSSGCYNMKPFLSSGRFEETGMEFKCGVMISNFSKSSTFSNDALVVNSKDKFQTILSRISYGFSWFIVINEDTDINACIPALKSANSGIAVKLFDVEIIQAMAEALKQINNSTASLCALPNSDIEEAEHSNQNPASDYQDIDID